MVCDAKTSIWVMGIIEGQWFSASFSCFVFVCGGMQQGLKLRVDFAFFFFGIWLFSFHLNVILHQWKVWQCIGSADLVVVKILVWSVYLSISGRGYADRYEIICRNAYEMVISLLIFFLFLEFMTGNWIFLFVPNS